MKEKNLNYLDVYGIKVPWRASTRISTVTPQGVTVTDKKPGYIVNLEKWLETGSGFSLSNGLLSLTKEILLELVRESGFKVRGYDAPIAVSAEVPYGHVFIDEIGGRIIVNEWEASNRAVDADGDRGVIVMSDSKEEAVLVKFPITSQPQILKVLKHMPEEQFSNCSRASMRKHKTGPKPYDREEVEKCFEKKHKEVPVGLLTTAHNVLDLWVTEGMPLPQRMNTIYNTFLNEEGKTLRYREIEEGAMKAARKEDLETGTFEVFNMNNVRKDIVNGKMVGVSRALADEHAPFLTGKSSIGSLPAKRLAWVKYTDLDQLMEDIFKLDVRYREVAGADRMESFPTFVEANLLRRLISLGLVKYKEYTHVDPNMPPCVAIWLCNAKGQPVGLTDVKRQGRAEGLTYAYLLSPVFDNVNILDRDGNVVVPASKKWVHPINHLAKMLSTFDSAIRVNSYSPVHHYFPESHNEWHNPKRIEKVAMLLQCIQDYCGSYGDAAGAKIATNGKEVNVNPFAMATATRSVVIDYGKNMDDKEMLEVASLANADKNICIAGSKSTSRRLRKYMLANEAGGSILDKDCTASIYRAACNRSQLFRAINKKKYKVALVKMNTQSQVLITSSGVKKQETNEAFLPQVFNTYEEYENHLKGNNLTPEECPALRTEYSTWQGETRVCWTIDGKTSIKIGKLVDMYGNKFMPRWSEKAIVMLKNGEMEEVDLIIPITEIQAKGCLDVILEESKDATLYPSNGQVVKCIYAELTFFRTGAASENVPPRWRTCSFKGMDSYPIYNQVSKIKDVPARSCDTSVAKEMQEALIQLEQYVEEV